MDVYEFIVTMAVIGVSGMGYLLLYRSMRRQIKEMKKNDKGNEE